MWFHNRVSLGLDVIYCTTYIPDMYLFIQSAAAAADAALCVAMLLTLLQLLPLLVVAVRYRVPHGKICHWFIESDSSAYFLFIQTRLYLLPVLSLLRPRFACTTSSAITGMRGAKAGVIPPRRSPPCLYYIHVFHELYSTRAAGTCTTRATHAKTEHRLVVTLRTNRSNSQLTCYC